MLPGPCPAGLCPEAECLVLRMWWASSSSILTVFVSTLNGYWGLVEIL